MMATATRTMQADAPDSADIAMAELQSRTRGKTTPPRSLPFPALRCSVQPVGDDLEAQIKEHNLAVDELGTRYASKCELPAIDYRTVSVADLVKQRDRYRQERLTCLQDAIVLGAVPRGTERQAVRSLVSRVSSATGRRRQAQSEG